MKLTLNLTLDSLIRALRWADLAQKETPVDTGKAAALAAKTEAQKS